MNKLKKLLEEVSELGFKAEESRQKWEDFNDRENQFFWSGMKQAYINMEIKIEEILKHENGERDNE